MKREKMLHSSLVLNNITNVDEMKHDFCVLFVRSVALNNVPLRNYRFSQNIEEPLFIIFIVNNDQKFPKKMIAISNGTILEFYTSG